MTDRMTDRADFRKQVARRIARVAYDRGGFAEVSPFCDGWITSVHYEMADAVLSAMGPAPTVAEDERADERRAIFDRITEHIDGAPCDGINAAGEFSETVWLSQRKFIDGMRQARVAAAPRAALSPTDAQDEDPET